MLKGSEMHENAEKTLMQIHIIFNVELLVYRRLTTMGMLSQAIA